MGEAGDTRHLVLVGLMGAGKSTVGAECARRLDRELVDLDELIVRTAGRSIEELFATEGEAGFRRRERDALAEVCASPVPLVVAAGGGAVLDPGSRRRMRRGGVVVWLEATPETLAARVGGGGGRPLLAGAPPEGALSRLAATRAPAYEAAAHLRVDTEGRELGVVVDDVLEGFASWNG